MKKITLILVAVLLVSAVMTGCSNKTSTDMTDAASVLRKVKTTQFFTDEKVDEADVQKILEAGVNAHTYTDERHTPIPA